MAHEIDDAKQPCFVIDGIRTLPLMISQVRLEENLYAFGKARASVIYNPPEYSPPPYGMTGEWLDSIGGDAKLAKKAVESLKAHISDYCYFVQLKNDAKGSLFRKLTSHLELITLLCDSRLTIDPSSLAACCRQIAIFRMIHTDYREDHNRAERYDEYSQRLKEAWDRLSDSVTKLDGLLKRIAQQIELRGDSWSQMLRLRAAVAIEKEP